MIIKKHRGIVAINISVFSILTFAYLGQVYGVFYIVFLLAIISNKNWLIWPLLGYVIPSYILGFYLTIINLHLFIAMMIALIFHNSLYLFLAGQSSRFYKINKQTLYIVLSLGYSCLITMYIYLIHFSAGWSALSINRIINMTNADFIHIEYLMLTGFASSGIIWLVLNFTALATLSVINLNLLNIKGKK